MPVPSSNNNNLLTNDIILKTALMEFENNLVLAKTVRRDYQKFFDNTTGRNIRIRKPTRYLVRDGRRAQPQGIDERYTNLTIEFQKGVDVEITSAQMALELDDFNQEVLNPAMVRLANMVDQSLYDTTLGISTFTGSAGVSPNSFGVASDSAAALSRFGIPRKDRFMLLQTDDANSMNKALYNTFNENFNKKIILDGSMGNLSGFDVYDVQNVIRPAYSSTGVLGTPQVNNGGQSGFTLVTDGWTININGIVKKGALFTIAGVNSVNPITLEDTGKPAQFVVTADANSDSGGNVTLNIAINGDGIILTGPYRNVTAAPANNASLTFNATHNKNPFYHREAFTLAMISMPTSTEDGAYQKNMIDPKAKTSIRMTRQYDAWEDQTLVRFDILYGVKCFPEYAGILMGG